MPPAFCRVRRLILLRRNAYQYLGSSINITPSASLFKDLGYSLSGTAINAFGIVVVGARQVGKTTLLNIRCRNSLSEVGELVDGQDHDQHGVITLADTPARFQSAFG